VNQPTHKKFKCFQNHRQIFTHHFQSTAHINREDNHTGKEDTKIVTKFSSAALVFIKHNRGLIGRTLNLGVSGRCDLKRKHSY